MKTKKISKTQTWKYRIYATIGRWLYSVRLRLEGINDYLDRQAGKYWKEE